MFYIYTRTFTTAVHGHAPRTRTLIARHGHGSTAGRNMSIHAATLHKTDTPIRCSVRFCAWGSLWVHTAPKTAHMREKSRRRTGRPRCRREPAREAKGCEVVRERGLLSAGQMGGTCERVLPGCAGSRLASGGGTPRPQWVGHGQGSSAKGDHGEKGQAGGCCGRGRPPANRTY